MAGPAPTTLPKFEDRSAGPVHSSGWLSGTFGRLREMSDDAVTHLLTNVRMCERVGTFRSINGVSERFDFDRRFLFQTALIRWRQAEAEPDAEFV